MPYPDEAYDWAREALGNLSTTEMPNSRLFRYLTSVERAIKGEYLCITGGNPAGALTISGADLDAYQEAVGYRIAARIVGSPAGRKYVANVTTLKVGPVTKQYGAASVQEAVNSLLSAAANAMYDVQCVHDALVAANRDGGDMYAIAGHRRAVGEPWTVEGALLGTGDPCVINADRDTDVDNNP